MVTQTTRPGENRSLGQLVSDLSEQTARLVRTEIDLAKEELAAKAKRAGIGSGLLAAAGVLALYTFAVGIAAAILGLAVPLPAWAAALIVFGALLLVTGLLAGIGVRQLKRSTPPTPERALENIKEDVAAVKGGLH